MDAAVRAEFGQANEDYLKAIFRIQEQEDGAGVSTSKLAGALSVSPAAATKAVQQLAGKKLVNYRPYHGVKLTPSGRKVALEIIRHHRLLETFLHDVLGYSWDEVDAEAERLEHHISEEFEARIDQLLNYPSHDPHGDPIPSRDGHLTAVRGKPLADCEENDIVVVVRVRDRNPEMLRFMDQVGLRLGATVKVMQKQPFGGPLTIRNKAGRQPVGRELAGQVFVVPVEDLDENMERTEGERLEVKE
jgi:DtxR family Mn-dependent transcriptional regulator